VRVFFKHVAKETVTACFLSITLFVVVLVSENAARGVLEWIASGRLSLFESVKIMATILPSVISYALPLGILTGVLISVGKLSSSNEILAMKSIGISLHRILLPVFLFAVLSTGVSCLINLYYAPNSLYEYRASFKKILRNNPTRFIKAREFINWFPGYVIYVDSISADTLTGFKIWQLSETGTVDVYITAANGTISYDDNSNAITLALVNGSGEHFNKKSNEDGEPFSDIIFFSELSIALPITEIMEKINPPEKKLRHMNINELLQARKYWHQNGATLLTEASIKHDRRLVDMNISSNIAMSFGVIALTLVAIPLGIRTKRSDTSVNTAIALILALGYYFSMVMFSWFGDKTYLHPEIFVWLPNISLAVFGIKMLRRSARY
jgi:lipopolysaccharide export system permease protein